MKNITHSGSTLVAGRTQDRTESIFMTDAVDALIKAGKDFDFIMVPGDGHGGGGRHGHRRRQDFFRKHLLDIEPPNYNVSRLWEKSHSLLAKFTILFQIGNVQYISIQVLRPVLCVLHIIQVLV